MSRRTPPVAIYRGLARSIALLVLAAIALTLTPRTAQAHAVGLSKGEYRVDGDRVLSELTFASGEAGGQSSDAFAQKIVGRTEIRADDAPCVPKLDDVKTTEGDGVTLRATFTCPTSRGGRPHEITLRAAFLEDLPGGHRHIAHLAMIGEDAGADELLVLAHEETRFQTQFGTSGHRAAPSLAGFVRLGVEHILTGYDHLLFLLALVAIGGRWKSIALVVTAFTVAHSITLGMAALGLLAPPPRLIEPLIAASIVYVGVENFFVRGGAADANADAKSDAMRARWRITFPFGLVHGFGFAGALQEIDLTRADVPRALLGFNVGVEVGQLAVLAAMLPLLAIARKNPWFSRHGVRALSSVVVALGLYWLVERIVHPA